MHAGPVLTKCTAQRKQEAPALVAMQHKIDEQQRASCVCCYLQHDAHSLQRQSHIWA